MASHSKRVADVESSDVVQISMTGTTFHGVVAFLRGHGLTVDPFPVDEGELLTYMVGISDELMRRSQAPND